MKASQNCICRADPLCESLPRRAPFGRTTVVAFFLFWESKGRLDGHGLHVGAGPECRGRPRLTHRRSTRSDFWTTIGPEEKGKTEDKTGRGRHAPAATEGPEMGGRGAAGPKRG